ncbi:hypothetical protein BJF79_40725 [Actinomadura sp. CNU-125]|uniref:SMI1/KNR4 family protein n=1 Tax=Actinomadura sp. CNU-125 TaxID=1904961 RepID=UPI00095F5585|nr:SMI1/KNR4 family protein [Actinomadura sp. CNU-125]OLT29666.1 hypothetical protein BJF79_40725 [Actinomadura sp. CNU-125]
MDRDEWRPWLKRWSEEWIAAHDPEHDRPLDPEVVRDGWLGREPAAPSEIAALEERLGLPLPPSLRGFLETTNGWRDAGPFIYRLGGTAEIGFLRDMRPTLIEAYDESYDDCPDMENDVSPLLRRSVQISLDGDSCDLFLDPENVTPGANGPPTSSPHGRAWARSRAVPSTTSCASSTRPSTASASRRGRPGATGTPASRTPARTPSPER